MENRIKPQLNQLLNRVKSSNITSQFRVSNLKKQNEIRLQSLSLKRRKIKRSLDRQMSLKGLVSKGGKIEQECLLQKTNKRMDNQPQFNLRKGTRRVQHSNTGYNNGYLRRPLSNLSNENGNKLRLTLTRQLRQEVSSPINKDKMQGTIHVNHLMGRGQFLTNQQKKSGQYERDIAFINAKLVNDIFHYIRQRTHSESQPILQFTEIIFKLVCYYFVSFINQNCQEIQFEYEGMVEFIERQLSQSYSFLRNFKGGGINSRNNIKDSLEKKIQGRRRWQDNLHQEKSQNQEDKTSSDSSDINVNESCNAKQNSEQQKKSEPIQMTYEKNNKTDQTQQQQGANIPVRRKNRVSSFFKSIQETQNHNTIGVNKLSFTYGVNNLKNNLRRVSRGGINPIQQEPNVFYEGQDETVMKRQKSGQKESKMQSKVERHRLDKIQRKQSPFNQENEEAITKNNGGNQSGTATKIPTNDCQRRKSTLILQTNNPSMHKIYPSSSSLADASQSLASSKQHGLTRQSLLGINNVVMKNNDNKNSNSNNNNKNANINVNSKKLSLHLEQQNQPTNNDSQYNQMTNFYLEMKQKIKQLQLYQHSLQSKIQQKDNQLIVIENKLIELHKQKQQLQKRAKQTQQFTKSQQFPQMIQTIIKKKQQITNNLTQLIEAHAWYGSNLTQASHIQHIVNTKQTSLEKLNLITRKCRACKEIQQFEPIINQMREAFLVTVQKYTEIIDQLQQKLTQAEESRSSDLKSLQDWQIQRKVKERIFNGCVVDYYTVERRVAIYVRKIPQQLNRLQHFLYVMEQKKKAAMNNMQSSNKNLRLSYGDNSQQNGDKSYSQIETSNKNIGSNNSKMMNLEKQMFGYLQKMLIQNQQLSQQLQKQKKFAMILEKIV